jgi:hypothetical protein
MATAAQISANQRNALKSTGPKTQKGKRTSSVNARRHGLHSALPSQDILAACATITGKQGVDLTQISGATLRLAIAEAQLARVLDSERALLARGDDDLRDVRIFDMIDDVLMEEHAVYGEISAKTLWESAAIKIRAATVFAKSTQQTYRSLRRALREAENAHASALSDWLGET